MTHTQPSSEYRMSQPKWKFLANLGDESPLEHGGFFVYVDETGVYPPEAEVLILDDESDDPHYSVYRFAIERFTWLKGVLSDNKFHPDFPVWFAQPEKKKAERPQDTTYLSNVAATCGKTVKELVALFMSSDPTVRADGYRCVADYHGWENFDESPMKMRKRELRKRYKEKNGIEYR